ncbi:MAG: hypothetical protein ACYS9X_29495, partial [Planctomycetota bacterium]
MRFLPTFLEATAALVLLGSGALPGPPGAAAQERLRPHYRDTWLPPDRAMLETIRPFADRLEGPPKPDGLVAVLPFALGNTDEANRRLMEAKPYDFGTPKEKWGYWDMLELLNAWVLYRDVMTDEAREKVKAVFEKALSPRGRIVRSRIGRGIGNHPMACMAICAIGGEQFGRPEVARRGYASLDRAAQVWGEVGSFAEYNSPTYLAVDLVALSTIRMYSTNAVVARKARVLEERAWIETGMRYHAPTWTQAGPFARAYLWDVIGGATDMQYLFRRVLGPDVPLFMEVT